MSEHLDRDQIHLAVTALADARSGTVSAPGVRAHLDLCPGCNKKVESLLAVEMKLRGLQGTRGSGRRGPDCPEEENWPKVAVGLLPDEEAASLMAHAATCAHCGPLLREATEDLAMAPTDQEIAELAAYTPEWQRKLAARLSAASRPAAAESREWLAWLRVPAWGYAVAAVVVVVAMGVGWFAWPRMQLRKTDQLLAEAYSEQRPFEPRLSNAPWTRVIVQRGGGSSDRPVTLLEAEGIVGDQLKAHPNDPSWIAAQGRVELLGGDYEGAIGHLQKALGLKLDTETVRLSLAAAYYQRGAGSNRLEDYHAAYDLLTKILASDPEGMAALYDRALAAEGMKQFDAAIEDWNRYLRLEPNGGWAEQVRAHRDAIRRSSGH